MTTSRSRAESPAPASKTPEGDCKEKEKAGKQQPKELPSKEVVKGNQHGKSNGKDGAATAKPKKSRVAALVVAFCAAAIVFGFAFQNLETIKHNLESFPYQRINPRVAFGCIGFVAFIGATFALRKPIVSACKSASARLRLKKKA
mmetsp:Transcript_33365/g.51917  ORF Transcript_33365/g.51917 Transcript_33365/m.51917 type:complete len:145 (+) Transcript_33365:63-497(+)